MSKGLWKLNDKELHWLSELDGRLGNIDIQQGCIWQCITCGVHAEKKKGNMTYNNYMTLSDSILEIKTKKKIDVLNKENVMLSNGSNPTDYIARESIRPAGLDAMVMDLLERHNKNVAITTTGWNPKNIVKQIAMENIINQSKKYLSQISITYSIKTVTTPAIIEYNKFLDKYKDKGHNNYELNLKFIRESKYFNNMMQNLTTLAPLNINTIYSLQYINAEHLSQLNEEYDKYKYFFSSKFMDQIECHIHDEWYTNTPVDENDKPYSTPRTSRRAFMGLGRTLKIGQIEASNTLEETEGILASGSKMSARSSEYFAQITAHGQLQIYYGPQRFLGRILVPKEHFIKQARLADQKYEKKDYRMLAELQGKNLFE